MSRAAPIWTERQMNDYLARRAERRGAYRVNPRGSGSGGAASASGRGAAGKARPGAPNATEARFNAEVLRGLGAYEAVTFRLPGLERRPLYTPDWCLWDDAGRLHVYEVKGSFRFGSEGRAACAFEVAAACFPHVEFNWARWDAKTRRWEWKRGGPPEIRAAATGIGTAGGGL